MNDDLIERAYAPRISLTTIAALIVAIKNVDHDGTNRLTVNYPPYSNRSDEFKTSTNNPKGN